MSTQSKPVPGYVLALILFTVVGNDATTGSAGYTPHITCPGLQENTTLALEYMGQ